MDPSSIMAAASYAGQAAEFVKRIVQAKNSADINAQVIPLQSVLMDLQQKLFESINESQKKDLVISELQEKLAAKEDWQNIARCYRLVSPWRGAAQAYAVVKSEAPDLEPRYLCCNCFGNNAQSILNPIKNAKGFVLLKCPACKSELETGFKGIGRPKFVEEIHAEQLPQDG